VCCQAVFLSGSDNRSRYGAAVTAAERGWGNPYRLDSGDMVAYDVAHLLPGHHARTIRVRNADVGLVFAEAVRRLVHAGWPGPDANTWGYNGRLKRWAQEDGQKWGTAPMGSVSEHAWGTAADFSTGINPMLERRPANPWAHTDMPREAPRIAADLGLTWGGNWTVPYDPQHWEIAGTPADVRVTAQAIRDQQEDDPMAGITMEALENMVTRVVDQRVALVLRGDKTHGDSLASIRGDLRALSAKVDELAPADPAPSV
jgi:D-alanyl-D-alanine carboxypeptidase-like protein